MGRNKKVKLSSDTINKSEMMSDDAHETHQPGMLSSKKKKSKKEDTSMQSTMSSYISTDVSKKKMSPKKEHSQASRNESSFVESNSDESLDHIKKRKIKDTTEGNTSKKMRLEHKNVDTIKNTRSNSSLLNYSHTPDMSNTSRSQEQKNILAPKSSTKKKGHPSNVSSDEGVDSGEEFTSAPKNLLRGHQSEEEIKENQLDEPHQQPEKDSESDWSKEQTEELICMMQERINVVKPKDSMSYRCRMKGLPWGDLPGLLHPPRTEQECNDQLHFIVENTKTVRNLFEVLSAYTVKPIRRQASVMIPFRRFMMDHKEDILKLKGNWIVNARSAFDALTEEERKQYTEPYNDEMTLKRSLKLKNGRPTFKIFRETLPNVNAEEQKKKFQALTPKQKIPFIKQAIKEHKKCLKDFEAQHGNDAQLKPPSSRLTKEEWRLFLESKGMPLLRAVSPFQLFLLDHDDTDAEAIVSGAKGNRNALRRYQDFTRSEHLAGYELKFKQELEEFSSNFRAWFGKVKDELWKEPAHSYYTEVTTSRGGVKKTRFNSKVTSKVQELEQSYVESTMIGKFCDEPVPAPLTAKDVFRHFAKAKNSEASANDITNTYNHLPKTHKDKFIEVATSNVEEYKAKLKRYVKNLSDHERRAYIGQNRVRFIRVFEGIDIFEKNYPCSEYPPFRIPSKNEKKSPLKKTNQSQLNLNFGSMFKTSSATNGVDEESGSEEQALPNKERTLSEESFKGRLPSTSTPGTVAKGIGATKQLTVSKNKHQEESDSGSSSSESSDEDVKSDGNDSTRYLDAVQKVHSKKLLEAYSETDSDESSDSEEATKQFQPAKASLLPASVQVTRKQPVASATGGNSSSSEEETSSSSSDENVRAATKNNSLSKTSQQAMKSSPLLKASPHPILSTKTSPQNQSPKKQKASSNKTATPSSSKLLQLTPKVPTQRQAESTGSESSDSEEETPPKKKSASGRMKPSLPPPKDDSSSEDDDEEIVSAWAK